MNCEYCNHTFKTKTALNVHVKTAKYCLSNRNIKIEEYKCESCNKVFSTKTNLNRHQTTCTTSFSLSEKINLIEQLNFKLSEKDILIDEQEKTILEQKNTIKDLQNTIEKLATHAISRNFYDKAVIEVDVECDEEEKPEEYKLKPLDVGDGYQIENRESDGYINVTNLCKAGGKKFNDWKRLNKTFDFLTILSNATGIPAASLIQYQTGYGSTQGTWVHPQVAINIAQWISPQFDVKVSSWVYEIMMTGKIDITNTKSYKELLEENKGHKIQIQKLNNKYVKQQPRVQYKESNVIYILTTKLLKKERRYILGKATNLTNRLSTYNKSDEHDVVYYQECPDVESMSVVETMVFQRLKKHREQANRERFILPKGEHIDLFRDVINEAIEFVMKER